MTTRRASFVLAFILGPVLALSTNVSITPARDWPATAGPGARMAVPAGQPAERSASSAGPSVVIEAGSPAAAGSATETASATPPAVAPTALAARPRVTTPPAPRTTVAPKPKPTATPIPLPTPTPTASSTPIAAVQTWTFDIYDSRAVRWQDPDPNACAAAVAQSMLNTIYYAKSSSSLAWQPSVLFSTQEDILAFERANMTMLVTSAGTDPHGWRNALNYYGWASATAGMYSDRSYTSLDAASRATVSAIATLRKPVGILARSGTHAQFVTGYKVTGEDPQTGSTNFSIVGVYVTDPLQNTGRRDSWTTYANWVSGGSWVKFAPYVESDSPDTDHVDGQVGTTEWYGHWVALMPVA
jgi:hypothetical protein